MQKYNIWEIRKKISSAYLAEDIVKEFNLDSNMAHILKSKELGTLADIKEFLYAGYESLLDSFLFSDIKRALNRIDAALKNNEVIYIYGDYDADGIMGTCILYKILSSVSSNVHALLPNRFKQGYGLSCDMIDKLKAADTSLIITVDNGITAVKEIDYASKLGIDVIITDHHECNEELPQAYSILNPKKPNEPYPFKDLCGAAIAFKLALAMIEQKIASYDICELITLAMIGTIADIVPLTGENRIIALIGLNEIKKTKNLALIELMDDANLNPHEITCADIGFKIAPRINAAGRMTDANETIRMFCSNDRSFVKSKVSVLSEINKFRQTEEKKIYAQAAQIVEHENPDSRYIWVLSNPSWHEGVIGISAGRLAEEYNRPFILISESDNICKGSARSISGFNIFNAIKNSEHLLERFGGHSAAAGFSINKKNISEFERRLNEYAYENGISKLLYNTKYYDYESSDGIFTQKFISDIELLSPFGYKNPKPQVRLSSCKISNITARGQDQSHISCSVIKQNIAVRSIAFCQKDAFEDIRANDLADILLYPKINNFNNIKSIEYEIKDIFFYNDCYNEYEKAAYKHFIYFYDKAKYFSVENKISENTVEESISNASAGEIITVYSFEMLKRIFRFLRYLKTEKEFSICFNRIEDYKKEKKYILICPLNIPSQANIIVTETNCFNTYEEDLYKNKNAVFLNNKYIISSLDVNRELLAYIYVRLSDISAICENKLSLFIEHLKKNEKYEFNYINVRLAIDIFKSIGLADYTYYDENDTIYVDKIECKEKKDINKSRIMIKLNEIAN